MAGKTDTPKKLRSKFFRIGVEGASTDGRKIERQWLVDAAETYNPNTYGARVWLEHMRSLLPDSPFKAYGDVVALKTEEVDIAGQKKLALFAQIDPTPELVAMNKARQKIFTSMEIRPKFSDTGRAYLEGLAVTDTPASLGTEMLTFSQQHPDASPLKARKRDPENLFTEATEAELEFEEIEDATAGMQTLFSRVTALLGKNKEKEGKDAAQFAEISQAVEEIATHSAELAKQFAAGQEANQALESALNELSTEFKALKEKLGNTQDHNQQQRPPVPGGNGQQLATF